MMQPRLPRTTGALVIGALLIGGLVAVSPVDVSPASAAAGDPEAFLVSRTQNGTSQQPYLSPDGQHVAFASSAGDLVAGDDNAVADIFVSTAAQRESDPFDTAAELVSRPDPSMMQVPADGPSSHPVMSADARYVAYLSAATNLVGGSHAAQEWVNVYVRDRVLGTTIRIPAPGGAEPLGDSRSVDMSDDGRYVVFVSEAANLSSDDGNETWDGFIADLDADGNGVRGDVKVSRVLPGRSIDYGVTELVISGNGESIAFATSVPLNADDPGDAGAYLYRAARDDAGATPGLIAAHASEVSIDATGKSVAYLSENACGNGPIIVASTFDLKKYSLAVGYWRINRAVGTVANPQISADGVLIAWETTQPQLGDGDDLALPEPIVRTEPVPWRDGSEGVQCNGGFSGGAIDMGVGGSPSPSASGRTVAFTGPHPANPAVSSVIAVDSHTHDGLSVTTSQGWLLTPGFMTIVDISKIPISSLHDYAALLADAPIHQVPIHQVPIHQVPIHQVPIHQVPIHQVPIHQVTIPGGWTALLADTPFAGELEQSVLLDDVLAWAEKNAPDDSAAEPAQRDAAKRILALTIDDVDLTASGIDSLSLASLVLGRAPVSQILIPGDADTATERWQAVVAAQAVDATVEPDTALGDLDIAGLDVGGSGIEQAVLRDLPIAATMFDTISVASLELAGTPLGELDASTLDPATQLLVYGGPVSGPLTALTPLADRTLADLAAGTPTTFTFGEMLFSLLRADDYPWEQIAPASIDANAAFRISPGRGCSGPVRCQYNVKYTFTFDPGPGEPVKFVAPTASVTLPSGTVRGRDLFASGSGPLDTWRDEQYGGEIQGDGNLVRVPLPDMPGGTVLELEIWHTGSTRPGPTTSTATLTSGAFTASAFMRGDATLDTFDDPANNWVNGDWEDPARPREALQEGRLYYEWIAESYRIPTDVGMILGPPVDEDYFLVDPPKPGQRLVISTNAADGQIAIALFAKSALAAPISNAPLSPMPGTAVTEQSGTTDQPAESGGDAAAPLQDHTLIDQAVVRGSGSAEVEAASTDAAAGEQMLLRVTSGNGQPSASLYSLRARYIDEPAEQTCASRPPAATAPGASELVTSTTNTLYLVDSQRMAQTYGTAEADRVRAAIDTLDGTGHVGTDAGTIDGAVISIDADFSVRAARDKLDGNPCSMSARRTLTAAINSMVAAAIKDTGAKITSVVLVGGDDIIPLAPVAQHTAQFNEDSHASSLRLSTLADGSACPPPSETQGRDLCATPLSAAAATNYILTDDPYGLADAFESLGGFLYVPTVGLGRLIETPDQIISTIDRFKAADGVLAADSTLARGYGAWSELPELVTRNLSWRATADDGPPASWSKDFLADALFPVVDDGTGADTPVAAGSARVISINAHADETRLLPGVDGAEAGRFKDSDLFTAEGRTGAPQLDGALVFQIGCHAGGNLPTAYYGDVDDWPDVFSSAGGFIGNTGYGLANNVTTALGERLLGLYADWVGRKSGDAPISASSALTYAKQSYLGGLGLYSGYDEKALMEAVYYGLPMYTFGDELREAVLPEIPQLTKAFGDGGALTAASLTLSPEFSTATVIDDRDRPVSYLVADGQDPLVVPGQPILPRVISQLGPAPAGRAARGALITALSSQQITPATPGATPAVAQPSVGVPGAGSERSGAAFPSTFATVTSQLTPTGRTDLLVVTPGRVETDDGVGRLEQFTQMGVTVNYGSTAAITLPNGNILRPDTTAPVFRSVDVPAAGQSLFRAVVDATADGTTTPNSIVRVLLLTEGPARADGVRQWSPTDLSAALQDFDGDGIKDIVWAAQVPPGSARWILQAVDAAGNVAIETARGHLGVTGASAPELDDDGTEATIPVGARLQRSVTIGGAGPTGDLTATVTLSDATGAVDSAGAATIKTDPDGMTHAIVDRVVETPGTFTATVKVCRGTACSTVQFPVTVEVANNAPSASVAIEHAGTKVSPTSVLTAAATASDPDGDKTTLTYSWHRNGSAVEIGKARTLDLSGKVAPGDVISVLVTPNDGTDDGHQARAEVLVGGAEPKITVAATIGDSSAAYEPGTWSRAPVKLTFTCTGGTPPLDCPAEESVGDTGGNEREITRSVVDDGITASVAIKVKVDTKPPTLSPTLSPSGTLVQGATASFTANATDTDGSGINTVGCRVSDTAKPGSFTLDTSKVGTFTIACTATDNAGNPTAQPSLTSYTVTAPAPAKCGGILDRTALAPVNADGSSVFLRGSGVPVSFRACDAKGKPIGTTGFVTKVVQVSATALPASAKLTELPYLTLPKFTYVKLLQTWTGSIPTANLDRGKKYTYRVQLADGTSFLVTFGVR